MSPYIIPGLKFHTTSKEMDFDKVLSMVLCQTNKTKEDIIDKGRTQEITSLRMVAMWLLRRNTPASLKDIGNMFNRDHTTVIHACFAIDNLIKVKDPRVMGIMNKIKAYL